MTTPLTEQQIALCLEAQRAYTRALGCIDAAESTFRFLRAYQTLGHLPKMNWPELFKMFTDAHQAESAFEGLIALLQQQGIDRETVMFLQVRRETPETPIDRAYAELQRAHAAVTALTRPRSKSMRQHARSVVGLSHD